MWLTACAPLLFIFRAVRAAERCMFHLCCARAKALPSAPHSDRTARRCFCRCLRVRQTGCCFVFQAEALTRSPALMIVSAGHLGRCDPHHHPTHIDHSAAAVTSPFVCLSDPAPIAPVLLSLSLQQHRLRKACWLSTIVAAQAGSTPQRQHDSHSNTDFTAAT